MHIQHKKAKHETQNIRTNENLLSLFVAGENDLMNCVVLFDVLLYENISTKREREGGRVSEQKSQLLTQLNSINSERQQTNYFQSKTNEKIDRCVGEKRKPCERFTNRSG
jgi:hypothetical protein